MTFDCFVGLQVKSGSVVYGCPNTLPHGTTLPPLDIINVFYLPQLKKTAFFVI